MTERIAPIRTVHEHRPMISVVALEPEYFKRRAEGNDLASQIAFKDIHSEVRHTPTPERRVKERLEEVIMFEVDLKNHVSPAQMEEIKRKITEVDLYLKVVYNKNLGRVEFNGLNFPPRKSSNGAAVDNGG